MWLQQGTFAGYRLYTDKSNPGSWSDVFFYQSDKRAQLCVVLELCDGLIRNFTIQPYRYCQS